MLRAQAVVSQARRGAERFFCALSLAPSVDWLRYISAFATLSMVYMIAIVTKNGITQLGSAETTPPLSCAGGGAAECGNVPAVAVVSRRTTHRSASTVTARRVLGLGRTSTRSSSTPSPPSPSRWPPTASSPSSAANS